MRKLPAVFAVAALTLPIVPVFADPPSNLRFEWVYTVPEVGEVGRYYIHCDGQTFMTGVAEGNVTVIEHPCPE